jgi:2C-methyl-D-erythritol 2,4-cyclodiphosphate synthase
VAFSGRNVLDDVVVFARNEQEMLGRLDAVFARLSAAGLKLKPRKCSLFARETEYLGHIVSEAGIRVNPD